VSASTKRPITPEYLALLEEHRARTRESVKQRIANLTPEEKARHLEKVARFKAANAKPERGMLVLMALAKRRSAKAESK
jgi:hypothetical protein